MTRVRVRAVRATFAVVAVLCLAAGCGGDDDDDGNGGGGSGATEAAGSDEAAIRQSLVDYGEALVDRDEEKACGFMTESAQEGAQEEVPNADSCAQAHERVMGILGDDKRQQFADALAKAELKIEVSGDTAELTAPNNPDGQKLKMRRVDGRWKIDQNTLFFNNNP